MTAAPSELLKITAPKLQAVGGYFFLLMNVRIASIVVINESTNAEDLGALPQTPPKPFLEERFRNPKNFTEKGIPPNERTGQILRGGGWGVCPSQ